jgi:hypothetical protein
LLAKSVLFAAHNLRTSKPGPNKTAWVDEEGILIYPVDHLDFDAPKTSRMMSLKPVGT